MGSEAVWHWKKSTGLRFGSLSSILGPASNQPCDIGQAGHLLPGPTLYLLKDPSNLKMPESSE